MNIGRSPLSLLVQDLTLRAPLEEPDRRLLAGLPCTVRSLAANSYVVREGDRPGHCAVLLSGFAYRHLMTGDGQRQIVSLHIPGEALDFQNLFLDVSDHSVQMLSRGEIAFVPQSSIQGLIQSRPQVAHAVMLKILVESAIFREWLLNVGRRDARTRAAHLFCEFGASIEASGQCNPSGGCELPMTQEQLGDALGLSAVHVNRVLKLLEQAGHISRNRRSIGIPAWRAMREEGDFNERYLHLKARSAPLGA